MLLRISSVHAIHWSRTCHVIFKRAHRFENSTDIERMTFALTWCANIFVGCSVTSTFFRRITSFSDSFHYTKKQKNLYVGGFNYFSYTIQIGSNWYMDTGVRDFRSYIFIRLILLDLMTYVAKIFLIRIFNKLFNR